MVNLLHTQRINFTVRRQHVRMTVCLSLLVFTQLFSEVALSQPAKLAEIAYVK